MKKKEPPHLRLRDLLLARTSFKPYLSVQASCAHSSILDLYNTSQCHHEHTLAPNRENIQSRLRSPALVSRLNRARSRHTGSEHSARRRTHSPHTGGNGHRRAHGFVGAPLESFSSSAVCGGGHQAFWSSRASGPLCARASSLFRQLGTGGRGDEKKGGFVLLAEAKAPPVLGISRKG